MSCAAAIRDRRGAAAGALGRFGRDAASAVPALIERLRATTSAPVSYGDGESSVWSLGQIAPDTATADKAVTALTAALDANSEYTRAAAVRALIRFGPKAARALPRIKAMQQDASPLVRAAATSATSPNR